MNRCSFSRSFSLLALAALASTAGCLANADAAGDPLAEAEADPIGSTSAELLSGYRVVTSETPVDTTSLKQLEVACPAGKVSVGGGFALLTATGGVLDGKARYAMPSWDGASWLVQARQPTAAVPWKLRVRVVCADATKLQSYAVVNTDSPVDTTVRKRLTMRCPLGSTVLTAGFGALDETSAILDRSAIASTLHADGGGWTFESRNDSTFAPRWKIGGRLICAAAVPNYQIVTNEGAADSTTVKRQFAQCPLGKTALTAGFEVLDGTYVVPEATEIESLPSADGASWQTIVRSRGGVVTPNWKLRLRLICA
jgi:hypothetical protein